MSIWDAILPEMNKGCRVLCVCDHSVLCPFQDYFSSYETGQSVGGVKQEYPMQNHLAHMQAEFNLSQKMPCVGLKPTPDTAER